MKKAVTMSARHGSFIHPVHNTALARIFHQMSDCYRYLGSEERFRAVAYERASRVLQNMHEDIAALATSIPSLDAIGGIGESIAAKIIEYLNTGKISTFEKLKEKVPIRLLELMDISGFGPGTLKTLHDKLGINNKDQLIIAIMGGRLNTLRGFGNRRIDNLKRALKLFKQDERMPYAKAKRTGQEILEAVRRLPGVQQAVLAGSLRRKKETIGDIDILIMANSVRRKNIADRFTRLPQAGKVIAKGATKASILLKEDQVQVDIRIVSPEAFGAALLYLTGSKEHNVKLRMIARERGMKLNEYGLFETSTGMKLAGETEEGMYHALGMEFIPPEQRTGNEEITRAMKKFHSP